MEAVGELDEDDPQVLRHRDHHLPDVLGLLLLVGAERDPAQFRHPIHEARDFRAELALDLLGGERGVLHGVMEKGGGNGRRVELQVGEDGRDLERVVDVVLAGQASLARVSARGALIRLPDHLLALRVQVVGNLEEL
jgi:hypothetical protein